LRINEQSTVLSSNAANLDFHLNNDHLNKKQFHPQLGTENKAINNHDSNNTNKQGRELIIETPAIIISKIKTRIESQEFDFHLNHESLNKNQFHPLSEEAKSEGKREIKKIKQLFESHFRKESSINKAAEKNPENLNVNKISVVENFEKFENLKSTPITTNSAQRVIDTSQNNENKFDFEFIHEKLNSKQFHPQVINFAKAQLSSSTGSENLNRIETNKSELVALANENKNKFSSDFRKEEFGQKLFHPTIDHMSVVSTAAVASANSEIQSQSLRKTNDFDFSFNHESLNNKQFHPIVVNRVTAAEENDALTVNKEEENLKQKVNNDIKLDFSFRKEQLDKKEFHPELTKTEDKKVELEKPTIPKAEVRNEAGKPEKYNLRGSTDNKRTKKEEEEKSQKSNSSKIIFALNEVDFSKEQIIKNPQFLKTFFGVDSIKNKTTCNRKQSKFNLKNFIY